MSKKLIKKLKNKSVIIALSIVIILLSIPLAYVTIFWGRIYPGVAIANVNVGGLKEHEAVDKLNSSINQPENMTFVVDSQEFVIPTEDINLEYNVEESINSAYKLHRTDNLISDLINRLNALVSKQNLPLVYDLDEERLKNNISVVAGQVAIEPIEPSISLTNSGIIVSKGQAGKDVDVDIVLNNTIKHIGYANFNPVQINLVTVDPSISDEEAQILEQKAEKILQKEVVLFYEENEIALEQKNAINLIAVDGINETVFQEVVTNLSKTVERPSQNAVFQFKDGRVEEFKPAREGLEIDEARLKDRFVNVYQDIDQRQEEKITIEIPLNKSQPQITTSEVNDLGINELLGKGESTYRGSIPNRVYNVDLAASKINGTIVPPGEVFSFNATLGDVSVYTGYKQAYVIMSGKTVLGDGGGVCQVSTTMFRAAMAAGLPIVERSPHSYRVGYYEQGYKPGIDATVYSPVTDFKFQNDTPNHILIQSISDSSNYYLAFEIYGTSDGRVATISEPVVSSVSPPPEDLYIDDPALPEGEIKQIDWAAWGAKAHFNYKVERDGEIIYEKTFYSNYRPWQAKFLRGTGPSEQTPQT